MNVVLHVNALRELREAVEWYAANGAAGRGLTLIRLVELRLLEVAKRTCARPARHFEMPYTLTFTVHDGAIVILAAAHGKRRPGYWVKRRPR